MDELAIKINNLYQDYDEYEYWNSVNSKEDGIEQVKDMLQTESGKESILEMCNDIIENFREHFEEMIVNAREIKEELTRL